uniref:Potassium channel domain-containing protein n=1 Tax=Trichuris muris TaxID=70415 RepID=A0A5S6QG27_TRIMR
MSDQTVWLHLNPKIRIVLSHVGLLFISCLYIVLGSMVFYHIEQPHEVKIRQWNIAKLIEKRDALLEAMWFTPNETNLSLSHYVHMVDDLTESLLSAYDSRYVKVAHLCNTSEEMDIWTYRTAIFFTASFLTTIGYGNLVPVSAGSKAFSLVYGLIGIPLILITIANCGKFLGECMVMAYNMGRNSSKLRRLICAKMKVEKKRKQNGASSNKDIESKSDDQVEQRHLLMEELNKVGLRDFVDIPASLVLAVLLVYITMGAVLFQYVENWDFVDSLYFSFITMTTIGFGDLVPENQAHYFSVLLYIMIGLMLTTMTIDLVGVRYIVKVHYFGRAIQDASYTLVNIGGRLMSLDDVLKHASLFRRRVDSAASQKQIKAVRPGAFVPGDIKFIRYIDFPARSGSICKVMINQVTSDGRETNE